MALYLQVNHTRYFQYFREKSRKSSSFILFFSLLPFFFLASLFPCVSCGDLNRKFESDMNKIYLDSHGYAHVLDSVDTRNTLEAVNISCYNRIVGS